MNQLLPTLRIDPSSGVFIGDIFGYILSLPIALFLAFWLSSVKNKAAVVVGAFIGASIGFLGILGWAGTLIFDTELPDMSGAVIFFSAIFLCSVLGLSAAILIDLLVARANARDYRRQVHPE